MSCRFTRGFFIVLLSLIVNSGFAQGDLLITPKRLVFDGSKRVEEINLANIGKDTTTYTISFVQFKMDEKGVMSPISDTDTTGNFAHKNLRFFPRTVTLAPNEAQSVKVQLIKANELLPGEYRSHLFFKNEITRAVLGDEKAAARDSGISVNLKPVFGISIATIIRIGNNETSASISDALFSPSATDPAVSFAINRKGNFSVYGDVKVTHISPSGVRSEVALMKGLAVYNPNPVRKVTLPLTKGASVDYALGSLQIDYFESKPQANNPMIASAAVKL